MISYGNGPEIRVGDAVLIERGRAPGTIVQVIESAEEHRLWNVEEAGVMIKSPHFGLVFIPASTLAEDAIRFVARGDFNAVY